MTNERAQIVVVGAGLAGFAAAQKLHESLGGANNQQLKMLVLEGQNCVGGRVQTISHGEFVLELGAQWLHGAQDNPLFEWLNREQIELNDFEPADSSFKGKYCTSSGEQVSSELVKRVLEIMYECKLALSKESCEGLASKMGASQDERASQVFSSHLEAKIKEDEELRNNVQLVRSIFQWFLRYETIENCCDHMDEVSLQSYTNWDDLGDGTLLNFRNGYSTLIDWFLNHLPDKQSTWLRLNTQVINIDTSDSSCTIVRYKNLADNSYGTIECQHVILTISVGCLKHNLTRGDFFTPPLPEVKQNLIQSIGFGTVNKIILQFEAPFWRPNDWISGMKLVWNDHEEVYDVRFPPWVRDILAFDVVRRQPNLLIGWIGGRGAKLIESETNEQVGAVCVQLIERFLPVDEQLRTPTTRLIKCLVSRWHSNEFTRGSYSFQSMQSRTMHLDELHEPVYDCDRNSAWPRLQFAGEATAGSLYSTTHGAIISGWREANRLIAYLAGEQSNATANSSHNSITATNDNRMSVRINN